MPRMLSWLRRPDDGKPSGGKRAADAQSLKGELHESQVAQARLRRDLGELRKAHHLQARTLEQIQKAAQQSGDELTAARKRVTALEAEAARLRAQATEQKTMAERAQQLTTQLASLKTSYETADQERQKLQARLTETLRSRENLQNEHERMVADLATLRATIAARDAAVAALQGEQDEWRLKVGKLTADLDDIKARLAEQATVVQRAKDREAAFTHLQLEYDSLAARWEVARTQLEEAEEALKTSQATIKAAQKLSSSVEWRSALDGILDAASELVRFERGTLALVDELQEELKIEAARNSPIAVSEMSRFKVGEGIAGWALSHREPVLVKDSRSDPRFKASDPRHEPRSFIAVPLLTESDGLGVLTLARPASDPFDEHALRALSRVASDAATALINARLVHVLKQREGDLTALVQKAKELWLAGDGTQVVTFILRSAQELVGGTAALIALRGDKGQDLEVLASQGIPPEILQQRNAWGAPAAGDVIRTGKPWVSPMRDLLPPALAAQVEAAGLKALVSVPFTTRKPEPAEDDANLLSRSDPVVEDEVHGVLHVYRQVTEGPQAGRLEQLRVFAEQGAVAIRNVRKVERVTEQLQTSASLNTRLLGRERFINQLQFRIQQLEQELSRYKAA
jgi:hypothetical protein